MSNSRFELITHFLCPYVQRSVIVLSEKEIPYQRLDVDLNSPPVWFKALSPLGKVPLLRVDEKSVLFESAVICEYLDEVTPRSLHPQDPLEKAYHRAWIEFGSTILDLIGGLYNAKDNVTFEQKKEELRTKFSKIEEQLSDGPFFAGQRFCLIDAVYGPVFRYFDVIEGAADIHLFDDLPRIQDWRLNLKNRDSIRNAVTPRYAALLVDFFHKKGGCLSAEIFNVKMNGDGKS
ncbi:MAG: glutathione S-transferase family protein [Thiotrichaceae bacterium]|nr:glutathione S-transferase family protein [Thiotrichaceae bacterium]PCI12573.1 MAG: glutathione S-transferase [Thiotrichales bacterium]